MIHSIGYWQKVEQKSQINKEIKFLSRARKNCFKNVAERDLGKTERTMNKKSELASKKILLKFWVSWAKKYKKNYFSTVIYSDKCRATLNE